MESPKIFDPQRVAARRARALRRCGGESFLRDRIGDDLIDRLHDTTRNFERLCDVASLGVIAGRVERGAISKVTQSEMREVKCKGEVAELIDLKPATYDVITSVLGLGFVNDLPGALIQCRLGLKPDGYFLAALYGPQTLIELREAIQEAEIAVTGGAALRILPFVDASTAAGLMGRAGFALPVVDQYVITVNYLKISTLFDDLRDLGHTASLKGRIPALRRQVFAHALALLEARRNKHGTIPITFEVITLTGWSPSPDQPKALRPGSAKARLADALNTVERPAGEKAGS
jgi:NADH dehydrogenase [ubiquinone] 1 alpha subcomplex assembly factor 5